MANGDSVIRPGPARIDVAELVAELAGNIPRYQRQLWADAVGREWRDLAAEQRIAAVREISPELAQKIASLPTAEQGKYLDIVAAVIELVSALASLYSAPPDPQTITQIVINIEGPDVTITVPPSQED